MVQSSSMGLIMIGLACLYITFQVTSHQRIQAYSKDSKKEDVDTSAIKITEHTDLKIASDMKTSDVNLSKTTGYAEQTGHDICHVEAHNEYHGSVVKWGDNNLLDSPEACCEQCRMTENCNAWVYCNDSAGCGGGAHPRPFKECWLKHAELLDLMEHVIGRGHAGISWASGVLYTEAEYAAVQQQLKEKTEAEDRRRIALRDDPEIPLVYMDVAIDGQLAGRIEAVLFIKESPLAAENLRQFCTGEKGPPFQLKGAYFYRIIDRFIDQTGVHGSTSIYGGQFKDDPGGLKLKHDRPYLLSIANGGPNTNTAHFSITVAPAPHLNGLYVIFGECVSGFDVIQKINALSKGQKNNELLNSQRAQIVETGQLRRGTYLPPPTASK